MDFYIIIKWISRSINESCCCFGKKYFSSANYPGIQKKIHGSGTATVIISNKEMNDIMKIVQALEDSNILSKWVIETIKNETKEQKGGLLSML